jgi:hypothetical protein
MSVRYLGFTGAQERQSNTMEKKLTEVIRYCTEGTIQSLPAQLSPSSVKEGNTLWYTA